MKVHYPKLYNMAHLLALNVLLLPKDLTIIFIFAANHMSLSSLVLFDKCFSGRFRCFDLNNFLG